ncbi:MAG: OmpA family protein [Candidatus Omnitrophica bacterium]|nr:OmpA family protein [Candidatus Omnitrophota bacterium]
MKNGKGLVSVLSFLVVVVLALSGCATDRQARKKAEIDAMQKEFEWWPTDAKPSPVKDPRGGFWWWPAEPGQVKPWGNRGYVYLYKIIYDYQEEDLPPAKPQEMRPSLLIKKIIKNVKVYFDYDKSDLRSDAKGILEDAVGVLGRNPESTILITGNADIRGPENYNLKLGKRRAERVKQFMLENGIPETRIKIVSRGKLDAVAPITDLVGMQKDRNAQFMIAEVEEVMLPAPGTGAGAASAEPAVALPEGALKVDEGKYIAEVQESVESAVKVSTKEYTVKKGDSLWKIAEKELGSGHRWQYLYELNKDRIKNSNRLKPGQTLLIPVE